MGRRTGSRGRWLVLVLLLLVVVLLSAGEGGGSVLVTLFAGLVVVWMVFSVLFGRRRR